MLKYIFVFFAFIFTHITAFAHGVSQSDQALMESGNFMHFMYLGTVHMVTGYDHILFIFGVIFFLTKFKAIVKFITAFTLGHSITLIFATLFGINANYFLVDAVIAFSVIYKGFENIDGFKKYFKVKSPNLLFIVFLFGLIHGFGLSTRLQQIAIGSKGLLLKIISFNIGVEIGQIIALTVLILLISRWRKKESFSQFSTVSNTGLIIAGTFLLIMQMHGYFHTTSPEEFGFPKDKHTHIHADENQSVLMQQEELLKTIALLIEKKDNKKEEKIDMAAENMKAFQNQLQKTASQQHGHSHQTGQPHSHGKIKIKPVMPVKKTHSHEATGVPHVH
jgi:hypothetical protein